MNWIFEDPLIRNQVFNGHRIYLHTEKSTKTGIRLCNVIVVKERLVVFRDWSRMDLYKPCYTEKPKMMTKVTFRKRMLALANRHVTNINRFELGCTSLV